MQTIDERWCGFALRCIDPASPPDQFREMRIAFYAGFKAMLDTNFELAEMDEVVAVLLLERLHTEARRFDPNA